jgi:fructoselysine-6-P-deglycase FrlB-like protein
MDYTMVRESNVRHGLFTVTSAGTGTAVFTDDYVETTNIGVVLAASQTGANSLVVTANSTSTGDSVSLTYSISHLA